MTGKNLMRRIQTMTLSVVLASLLWSCAGANKNMATLEPQTETMEPQMEVVEPPVRVENPYGEFPGQGVKAILDAAHAAAIEQPDFGSVNRSRWPCCANHH